MKNNVKSVLAVTFAFALLAIAGSANAIIVRGFVDPLFSATGVDANLGWTALIQFDVDQSCLIANQVDICEVSNLQATGTLYDDSDPNHTALSTLDFINPNYVSSLPATFNLTVDNAGIITGIDTGPIGWASATNSLFNGNLWVEFFSASSVDASGPRAQLIAALCEPLTFSASTFTENHDCDPETQICVASTDPANDQNIGSSLAFVRITQVPEPGSLALVFGALVAGWSLRRRRLG